MSEVLQYELWRACNCKCTFCTLGKDNLFTSDTLKLQSLNVAINELSNLKPNEHKIVGFIGGEFFQGQLNTPEIKDKFFELICITNDLLNKGYIQNIWLNASLLIGKQPDLYDTLNLIDKKDKLWVLTSYDTIGRFHTQKMLDTWEYHIFKIHELYPEININTTSILTGDFIERYNNGQIDLLAFRNKYKTSLFFKNPVAPLGLVDEKKQEINDLIGNFFPKRHNFLTFLRNFLQKENIYEYDKLISTDLRADEIRKNYNNEDKRNIKFIRNRNTLHEYEGTEDNSEDLSCGHNNIYASYVDSDKCMLCDKKMIRNLNYSE